MKVSINTPNITANPNWNTSLRGKVVSTEKVPAKIIPADVTTPPVRPIASEIPLTYPDF